MFKMSVYFSHNALCGGRSSGRRLFHTHTVRLLAILPEDHCLADYEKFPVTYLCEEPFVLLKKGIKA